MTNCYESDEETEPEAGLCITYIFNIYVPILLQMKCNTLQILKCTSKMYLVHSKTTLVTTVTKVNLCIKFKSFESAMDSNRFLHVSGLNGVILRPHRKPVLSKSFGTSYLMSWVTGVWILTLLILGSSKTRKALKSLELQVSSSTAFHYLLTPSPSKGVFIGLVYHARFPNRLRFMLSIFCSDVVLRSFLPYPHGDEKVADSIYDQGIAWISGTHSLPIRIMKWPYPCK